MNKCDWKKLTLFRLITEAIKAGVEIRRKIIRDIKEVFEEFPNAGGFVNCTGIGSYRIKGIEDRDLYPTMVRFTNHNDAGPS